MNAHKTLPAIWIALLTVACTVNSLYGQITVTKADLESALAVGATSYGYNTPSGIPVTVNVGTASGTSQIWDFRNYTYGKTASIEFIDPSTSPHANRFPTANVVRRQVPETSSDAMLQYNEISATEYLLHAIGYDPDTMVYAYSPPVVQMKLPLTYGTNWVFKGNPQTPYPGVTMTTSYKRNVDAFGTIRLPEGDFPALRMSVETTSEAITPVGSTLHHAYSYSFICKTLAGVYITIDSNDVGKASVQVNGIGYEVSTDVTGIHDPYATATPLSVKLSDGYPNPITRANLASSGINFEIEILKSGPVSLDVFDMLGRKVESLRNDNLTSGTHSVVWKSSKLTNGMHFCTFTQGTVTVSKKFAVVD